MKEINLSAYPHPIVACTAQEEISTVVGKENASALCNVLQFLCFDLGIPMPDIAFAPMTCLWACLHTPDKEPLLTTPLMMLSLSLIQTGNGELIFSTVAHEMRHLWQAHHKPELYQQPDVYGIETLLSPKEIDADAYGAAVAAAVCETSVESVLRVSNSLEYALAKAGSSAKNEEPYLKRLNLAEQYLTELREKHTPKRFRLKKLLRRIFRSKAS